MSAGYLRDRVKILTPVTADDGAGGQTVDWDNASFVYDWASIRDATSRDQLNAGAVQTLTTHVVKMHFATNRVSTEKRILRMRDDLTLEILGDPRDVDGRQRYMELLCSKVIA